MRAVGYVAKRLLSGNEEKAFCESRSEGNRDSDLYFVLQINLFMVFTCY